MLVALIALVVMTLAAITVTRSSLVTNRIAGNLSFQQAATQSADPAIEAAVSWLEAHNTGTTLNANISIDVANGRPVGYFASNADRPGAASWERFWTTTLLPSHRVNVLPTDAAGNTASYVIQRLCNGVGDPNAAGSNCAALPDAAQSQGNSQGVTWTQQVAGAGGQRYYLITVRIAGPRQTTAFVQAVVAI